jgi:hypothetical protein
MKTRAERGRLREKLYLRLLVVITKGNSDIQRSRNAGGKKFRLGTVVLGERKGEIAWSLVEGQSKIEYVLEGEEMIVGYGVTANIAASHRCTMCEIRAGRGISRDCVPGPRQLGVRFPYPNTFYSESFDTQH